MERKTPGIAEILELSSKQKTRQEQIDYLRANFSAALADILKIAYHPAIKFLLPEGTPPYNKSDIPDQEFMMYRHAKKLYLFLDGGGNHLKQLQREKLFIDMLEAVSPRDAEMMIMVKDKALPYGITYDLVKEAFPDLLPDLESK